MSKIEQNTHGSTVRVSRVPVHVITGPLGVGKTTAIRDLLERVRPPHERWAVLVNEVGEVGIDGAFLEESAQQGDGLPIPVRQVPGGCICCTNGILFQMHLTLLLQQSKPDRVIIEPSGVAEPGAILDLLQSAAFSGSLQVGATITLIDPRKLHLIEAAQEQHKNLPILEQVDVADVLVANKADLCDAEHMLRFEGFARACFPPKLIVAATQQGRLERSWLDALSAQPDPTHVHEDREEEATPQGASPRTSNRLLQVVLTQPLSPSQAWTYEAPRQRDDRHVHAAGWQFEPSRVFHAGRLRAWLEGLEEALPGGFLRVKGVLQTERGWVAFNLVPDGEIEARASSYRRDARLEILTSAGAARPAWAEVHQALLASFYGEHGDVATSLE